MDEPELRICAACAAIVAMLPQSDALATEREPFRTANLSPPIAIIGMPFWSPVPEATTMGVTFEVANHYRLSQADEEALMLDGETSRLRAWFEKPIGDRWSVSVDVPLYRQSGGVLDDVVDSWHSAFGMPDGGRNYRPEDLLEYRLVDVSGPYFELTDSSSALGDVQLSMARGLGKSDAWTLRGTVKLATGDEDILAGSGATDISLAALRLKHGEFANRSASYYLGAAWLEIGEPSRVRFDAEDRAVAGLIGGALALGPRYGVKGQIEVNSALYVSDLEEIGQTAVQATIGGWLLVGETMSFDFAVSEDLHVSTSPDVVIVLGLSARLR